MRWEICATRRLVLLAAIGVLILPGTSEAQRPGRFSVSVYLSDDSIVPRPVMLSAIHDGRIVGQQEFLLTGDGQWTYLDGMPVAGLHDLRLEGEGIVTEVKRGIHLFEEKQAPVAFVVRPGEGLHAVEYAVGGLAREEVAMRLAALETLVEELQEAMQSRDP